MGFSNSPARRLGGGALAALLVLVSGPAAAADEAPDDLDRRIAELVEQRERLPLDGPVLAVAFGAWMLSSGISSAATAQYQCWDGGCSDEVRWGITAGAGALAVIGLVSVGFGGNALSKRLRTHREIAEELCRLRGLKEPHSHVPSPSWGLGVGWTDERRELRIAIRY